MNRFYVLLATATVASPAVAQNLYSNQSGNVNIAALNYQGQSRSGVNAPAGGAWSEVQANGAGPQNESNTSAGFSVQTGAFRLADDFAVSGPGWIVNAIRVYAYQTGSTGNPFTGGSLNVWNGRPGDAGASIVSTGTWASSTDVLQLTASTTGNAFRIFNTDSPPPGTTPGQTRRIWENRFTFSNVTFGPGTYWIDYSVTVASGAAFAPSTTHQNLRGIAGANARQFNVGTSTWTDAIDTGNPGTAADVAQDMPFIVSGEPVPEPATLLLVAGGASAALARRRRKAA